MMKLFTKRYLIMFVLLLGCLSIHAAEDNLITKQITIKLDEAGTLPDKIGDTKKYQITNLKIIGEINGTDLKMIRKMAGCDSGGSYTEGKLSVLDLKEAKVVEGGAEYFCSHDYNTKFYHTSKDKIGDYAFSGCSGLTSLTLPSGVTEIGGVAFRGWYAEKLPKMGSDVFTDCDAKKCIVYVPKGTYDDYWLSEFGYFENIVEFDATGIDKITTSSDDKEVSRYSVNGQRLSTPTKGLNIVKYSDGSVKKVAVQ